MNPNEPLSREQVTLLVREAPEAVVNLVMVMQEQIAELRAEVRRLQERVAELEEQNRPPSAPFRRREEQVQSRPEEARAGAGAPRELSTLAQAFQRAAEKLAAEEEKRRTQVLAEHHPVRLARLAGERLPGSL